MSKLLIVVDMQKDFVDGSLGTPEAVAIDEKVATYVKQFNGKVIFTKDTHGENYLNTKEGKSIPVVHCVKGTRGHDFSPFVKLARLERAIDKSTEDVVIEKDTFGYRNWELLRLLEVDEIEVCGLCTDICVIANVILLKTALPETEITVLGDLCAGTTPEKHIHALGIMKTMGINIK